MRAEAKSPGTIDTYTYGLNAYLSLDPPIYRYYATPFERAGSVSVAR